MKAIFNHIAIILTLLLTSLSVVGQTRVEVITKTVEKRFAYQPGYSIRIDGESAKIQVKSWQEADVKVEIKLISKGLRKAIAEKELEYQRYTIDAINKEHIIKNFLLVPKDLKELSSIQETEIKVFVPVNAPISIRNKFGLIEAEGLKQAIKIDSEYGDIVLRGISGDTEVTSNFGDLMIDLLKGKLKLSLAHTETEIVRFDGRGSIVSSLGNINIRELGASTSMNINGMKSDVKVQVSTVHAYRWLIKCKYGKLIAPAELTGKIKSIKNIRLEFGVSSKPPLNINTDFGKIEVTEL